MESRAVEGGKGPEGSVQAALEVRTQLGQGSGLRAQEGKAK